MRTPRHYMLPRFDMWSWFIYQQNDKETVLIPDSSEGEKEFFFDTDRGRSEQNDCVHSKIVSAVPGGVSINNVKTSRGIGLPQGQFSAMNTGGGTVCIWSHKWFDINGKRQLLLARAGAATFITNSGLTVPRFKGYVMRVGADVLAPGDIWSSDSRQIRDVSWMYTDSSVQPRVQASLDYGLPVGYFLPGPPNIILGNTRQEIIDGLVSLAVQYCQRAISYCHPTSNRGRSMGNYRIFDAVSIAPENFSDVFLFSEDIQIPNRLSDIALGNPRLYWKNWLIQHAYLEACRSVPTLNDNSISNVLEIVGFMKALVVDRRIEFPKRLQDLWLAYRYSYKTTELDVNEAIKFAQRYMSLGTLDTKLKCYGQASTDVDGTAVTCRCALNMTPTQLGYVEKLWRTLATYGLGPSFYIIWDMIPYSFIVDWFIPVGDVLSVLDAESRFSEENYIITDVVFSLSYVRTIGSYTYKAYARWRSSPLTTFNEFYWFDKPKTSAKVKTYRILDAISLFS